MDLEFKDCLNLQEFDAVKERLVTVFNHLAEGVVTPGDKAELIKHLSEFVVMFRLFQAPLPEAVSRYNERIFSLPLIRDFHLELLERFSMEVLPIGDHVFERLINTLALAAKTCKAPRTDKMRADGLSPVLISIHRSSKEVVAIYLENPWLVTLALLNTQFKRTEIGKAKFEALVEPESR